VSPSHIPSVDFTEIGLYDVVADDENDKTGVNSFMGGTVEMHKQSMLGLSAIPLRRLQHRQ
jgi:hypothetical protein